MTACRSNSNCKSKLDSLCWIEVRSSVHRGRGAREPFGALQAPARECYVRRGSSDEHLARFRREAAPASAKYASPFSPYFEPFNPGAVCLDTDSFQLFPVSVVVHFAGTRSKRQARCHSPADRSRRELCSLRVETGRRIRRYRFPRESSQHRRNVGRARQPWRRGQFKRSECTGTSLARRPVSLLQSLR